MINDYYTQQGCGSPIVFIHGSYATDATWKKMCAQLSHNHHCISIKLPGHCGLPDPSDFSQATINTELTIIEDIVSKLVSEPVHLIGHSYGGVVALALALKNSIDIKQMTLFEPVATWVLELMNDDRNSTLVSKFLSQYRHDVENNKPHACGQVIDFWNGKGSYDTLPDFIKESMQPLVVNNIRHWDICTQVNNSVNDLRNCSTPTKLIYGQLSNPIAHAICQHLSTVMPNISQHIIEGASHFLVTSHIKECLAFLEN